MAEPAGSAGLATPVAAVELELKLRFPPDAPVPLEDGVSPPELAALGLEVWGAGAVTLTAAYFDTSDFRLARCGAVLRRRTGGSDAGWHLKLPLAPQQALAGVTERLEIQLPLAAGTLDEPPAELRDLVAPLTRGARLRPLAQVRTRRRLWDVVVESAALPIVLIADDDVTVATLADPPEGAEPRRFREIEVEVAPELSPVEGPLAAQALAALGALLVRAGGEASSRSKGAEALGEGAWGAPDVVVGVLTPKATTAELLRTAIAAQVERLTWADVAVRRGAPEGIHDFRVAARRLRSLLGTFAPVLRRKWARRLRRELAWAAGALGEARDCEVQLELLLADAGALREGERALVSESEAAADAALAGAALAAALEPRFAAARAEGLAHLRRRRYLRLLRKLVRAAREPRVRRDEAERPAVAVLGPLARAAEAEYREAAGALVLGEDAPGWHRARIRAKRARYAAETLALVPTGAKRFRRAAGRLSEVTTLLGAVHDAHVSRATLRQVALAGPAHEGAILASEALAALDEAARTAYLLGVLDGRVAARERALQTTFFAEFAR